MTRHRSSDHITPLAVAGRADKRRLWAATALAGTVGLALVTPVRALPVGGVVTAGSAAIGAAPKALAVTQSSQNVVIDWQSFSIAQGESVVFTQPNSTSVALNRVIGNDPSAIFGTLSANGNIFLVNPSGVLFGKGAQVNVGGLIASTQGITDANLMAGRYNFDGASTASTGNAGVITASGGGYVALLGANVSNTGRITARLGSVVLGAGQAMTLDVAGDGLLNITISRGAIGALAANGGLIQANGGQVVMTARAAGALIRGAVNNTGAIEAQTIANHDGVIELLGDPDSTTTSVAGVLDASGLAAGETGGRITVTGQHVGLFDASLVTSGDAGGGGVRIGGGLHGLDASIDNATATYVSADSTIAAKAVGSGSGGQVVVWSNQSTRAYGSISSRGGAAGGDGGLIETSGHWLDVSGAVIDAAAPKGKDGVWLLDPADVTISASTSNGSFSGGNPDIFTPDPNASASTVNANTIVADLNAGTNVQITSANLNGAGEGDITVASGLTWTGVGVPTTLTLNAVRDVDIGAAITATNGSLVVIAGRDVNQNAAVSTTGGAFTATALNDVNLNAAVTAVNGTLTANAARNVNAAAALTVTNGNIVLQADTGGTGPGVAGGTVAFIGAGAATLNNGVATIIYNPVSYTSPNNYAPNFSGNGTLNALMLVFPLGGNKVYDGTTTATVGLVGAPPVTLTTVNPQFDTKDVGNDKPITFDSSSLSAPGFVLYTPLGSTPGGPGQTTGDITPAPLTVTANDVSKVYGVTPALTGFISTGLVAGDTIASVTETSAGQTPTAAVAGSPYAITPSNAVGGTFSPSNYVITYVNGSLTVTPAPLIITAGDVAKLYGQTPALTAFTSAGLVNGDTVGAVSEASPGQAASAAVAGSPYAITPSNANGGTFVASNYVITYLNGALTITPAPLLITASDVGKLYGQTPALTAFTTAGLVNGDTVGAVVEASPGQAASASVAGSPYAIAPSGASGGNFVSGNYVITYANGALTVAAAPLTVTASDVTKVYGTTPALTGFAATGLVNGDTVSSVTETSPGQAAGAGVAGSPYAITPAGAVGTFTPGNYVVTYVGGVLTVTPAALSVMASDASKLYGENFTPTAFTAVGLVNGDTIGSVVETSPGSAAAASPLGSPYPITASAASGGSYIATNYVTTYSGGSLTVLPSSPGAGSGGSGGSGGTGGSSGSTPTGFTDSGLAGPSQGTTALLVATENVADVSFDSNHIANSILVNNTQQNAAGGGVMLAVLGAGVNMPAAAVQAAEVQGTEVQAAQSQDTQGQQTSVQSTQEAGQHPVSAAGSGTGATQAGGAGTGTAAAGAGRHVARARKQDRH